MVGFALCSCASRVFVMSVKGVERGLLDGGPGGPGQRREPHAATLLMGCEPYAAPLTASFRHAFTHPCRMRDIHSRTHAAARSARDARLSFAPPCRALRRRSARGVRFHVDRQACMPSLTPATHHMLSCRGPRPSFRACMLESIPAEPHAGHGQGATGRMWKLQHLCRALRR